MSEQLPSYLIENQYFPVIDWFKIATVYTHVNLEQFEKFQKASFRNRCLILGSNGLISLTVPLDGGRENREFVREVKIDNSQAWQRQHWRSIVSSYSRAPFFEHYADGINQLLQKRHTFLFDMNYEIVIWLLKVLNLEVSIGFTDAYRNNYDSAEYQDLRNNWLPRNLDRAGGEWTPKYTQVFEDRFRFIPNLSILDLLFCRGSL